MSAATVSFRAPLPAWAIAAEDEARFKRILRSAVGMTALACAALALMPRPQGERAQPVEVPQRLARVVLEREPRPQPAPPAATEGLAKTALPPLPRPAAAPPAPTQRLAPDEPRRAAASPAPSQTQGGSDGARSQAAGAGLLAMTDDLNELRRAPVAAQLQQDLHPRPGADSGAEPGVPARALLSANLTGGSGGINAAAYSRNTGSGTGLAGRAPTQIESPGSTARAGDASTQKKGGSGKATRSIEEIKIVFERNKGAIYALYNRALREDPALQGKVVVELKISPAGDVVHCRVVSTELKTPEFEQKLVARIRQFNFGAKDTDVMIVSWPVDFLPS